MGIDAPAKLVIWLIPLGNIQVLACNQYLPWDLRCCRIKENPSAVENDPTVVLYWGDRQRPLSWSP